MTPYEAIANRTPQLAQLTDKYPALAPLFIKAIQGIYLFVTDKKINPDTIQFSSVLNSDGLIFNLTGKKRTSIGMCRDFYTRRMHDYGKIAAAVRKLSDLFRTITKYVKDHKDVTVKLSASGDKLIISGEKIYA
jgi:hypothetical protein